MADRFTWCATRQSSAQANIKVKRAQFGDGYAQSSADGLNSVRRTWDMTFIGKKSKMADIISFLDSHSGKSFIWNDPFYGDAFFYCDEYRYNNNGSTVYTVTATFEQTFQP